MRRRQREIAVREAHHAGEFVFLQKRSHIFFQVSGSGVASDAN